MFRPSITLCVREIETTYKESTHPSTLTVLVLRFFPGRSYHWTKILGNYLKSTREKFYSFSKGTSYTSVMSARESF